MARKQRHEQTHHGGAWKVAYADFVTAMMSLFIVLWVLGSSVENQVAVAAYFRHPSIFKKGGSGFLNKEGMLEYQRAVDSISAANAGQSEEAQSGDGDGEHTGPITGAELASRGVLFRSAEQLMLTLHANARLRDVAGQVSITFTSQGMRIQLEDREQSPLFSLGSSQPTESARELLDAVSRVLVPLNNGIMVEGHTDSRPYRGRESYSNWELSGERANAARRLLEASGVDPQRIVSVVGYADRQLLLPQEPDNQRNRRISIIVCYEDGARTPALVDSLVSVSERHSEVPAGTTSTATPGVAVSARADSLASLPGLGDDFPEGRPFRPFPPEGRR